MLRGNGRKITTNEVHGLLFTTGALKGQKAFLQKDTKQGWLEADGQRFDGANERIIYQGNGFAPVRWEMYFPEYDNWRLTVTIGGKGSQVGDYKADMPS